MSWFQIWTVAWQISVFMTPVILGAVVLWLNSKFVSKTDALVEKNRVDAALASIRQEARNEAGRIDAALGRQKDERDTRYEAVKERASDHEARLRIVEADIGKPPTRHALNNELTKLVATVAGVEKALSGVGKQMDTMHGYVRTLVERGLEG